jgi:DNA-binding HxlR family transcriptional regulator
VLRRDFGEMPPRVDYQLTAMGRQVGEHVAALGEWIAKNSNQVPAVRDRHRRAGKRRLTPSAR